MKKAIVAVISVCFSAIMLCGCGSSQSKLVGSWLSKKDNAEINIERNGDVFAVEIVQNGKSSRFPGVYKDGILTIQNMGITASIYPDKKSGDLIVNIGGQEEHLRRNSTPTSPKVAEIRPQLAVAAAMYVSDWEGKMPPNVDVLEPYLGNPELMKAAHALQKDGYIISFRPDDDTTRLGVVVEITKSQQ